MKVLNIRDIPGDLYQDFKVACAVQGVTIKQAILTFMKDYIQVSTRDLGRKK